MHEIVYHSDISTKITGETVKLGGKSYRLADISAVSVSAVQTDRARNVPAILIVLGSLLMFAVTNFQAVSPSTWEALLPIASVLGMLIAMAGLTVLIIQMALKTDHIFIVHLKGTFGSACPFASDDEQYVRKIASALRIALKEQQSGVSPASLPTTSEHLPSDSTRNEAPASTTALADTA